MQREIEKELSSIWYSPFQDKNKKLACLPMIRCRNHIHCPGKSKQSAKIESNKQDSASTHCTETPNKESPGQSYGPEGRESTFGELRYSRSPELNHGSDYKSEKENVDVSHAGKKTQHPLDIENHPFDDRDWEEDSKLGRIVAHNSLPGNTKLQLCNEPNEVKTTEQV